MLPASVPPIEAGPTNPNAPATVVQDAWPAWPPPAGVAPIFERLNIAEDDWLELAGNFGRLFQRVAGRVRSVARLRTRQGRGFRAGGARLFGEASRLR